MTEPTITCPNCKTEIKLTESLAAPLVESMKKEYAKKLAEKEREVSEREAGIRAQEDKIEQERSSIADKIAEGLKAERQKIALEESKKAKSLMQADLDAKAQEVAGLQEVMKEKDSKLAEAQKAQAELIRKERELDDAKREVELTVAKKVEESLEAVLAERTKIAAAAAGEKVRLTMQADLDSKAQEFAGLQEVMKEKEAKLAEAQKAQAELIRKERELDDAKREMELTVEKRVQDSLSGVRDKARKEAEDELKLKVSEKEQTITAMQRQIEELKRKAEQGSQQLQGEVSELELESSLRAKFPADAIEPVAKGKEGGDVLQRIFGPLGQSCGAILWESKRTKNWSDGWLAKLRDDQRAAKAEAALLVSEVLPKGVQSFDLIDGVWVAEPRCAMPLAIAIRQSLIELTMARQAGEGQQTKMELVYQYLTGPRFKHRVEAIVEKFSDMHDDLEKERKQMTRLWAKREEQIRGVIESTAGMYGDLQGIAGRSLQEISGLSMPALGDGSEAEKAAP